MRFRTRVRRATFLCTSRYLGKMEPLGWSGPEASGILTPVLDAELEEYRLLAYMQRVEAQFNARKLYPWLEEVRDRTVQLHELRRRTAEMDLLMPGKLIGIDVARSRLLREQPATGRLMDVRLSVDRALQELGTALQRGMDLRQEWHAMIRCEPVGLLPIDTQEGWLLLRQGKEALVYAYSLPLVRGKDETVLAHRSIRTKYTCTVSVGLGHGYGRIKADLVRSGPLPNPAVFVFESTIALPRIETFLPLAKQIAYEWAVGASV